MLHFSWERPPICIGCMAGRTSRRYWSGERSAGASSGHRKINPGRTPAMRSRVRFGPPFPSLPSVSPRDSSSFFHGNQWLAHAHTPMPRSCR
jgi:hypothetical protein